MGSHSLKSATVSVLGLLLIAVPPSCSDGNDGPPGKDAGSVFDASTASAAELAALDVVSEITGIQIASPPVVTFTLETAAGTPIVGIVPFWNDSNRYVRFTLTKLVPGQNGDPDRWIAYVRDANSGEPDYDTGASLVDMGDGSYTFTFDTDVTNVAGVPYDPALTHRVAGQIGSGSVALAAQNLVLDFVPNNSGPIREKKIAVMQTCNECHTNLVFHGRRFKVEYCVQCHSKDLAEGEGDFSFMIHRIHNAGKFAILDDAISYEKVTYPQDVINCRKCHNADDMETPQADNWRNLPSMSACDGCHDIFNKNAKNTHSGPAQSDNSSCTQCHPASKIVEYHTTPNSTPNNPELLAGQRKITYEMISAAVDGGTNVVTIQFKVLSEGTPLDVTNLPADFKNGSGTVFRFSALLLAYALPQGANMSPLDYNNLGRPAGQPLSLSLGDFAPIQSNNPIGTLAYNAADGVMTAAVTDTGSQFPSGAKLRVVALQGYFQQDLDNDGSQDVALHAISVLKPVTGDQVRREIIDPTKCSQCHEWFEGHGGNRVFGVGSGLVCVVCHVPNLSSSGRSLDPSNLDQSVIDAYGNDPLVYPEDTQNMRDMIHGIHSSGFRTRDYEHVRNFRGGRPYDWSHVTFPRGSSTSNCMLCHKEGTYRLPLNGGVLPTTVRTTGVANGQDPTRASVQSARDNVPGALDWVNSPTGSTCFYCHTSDDAWAHMTVNGAQLSVPTAGGQQFVNRTALVGVESCAVCHGPGRSADLDAVHDR